MTSTGSAELTAFPDARIDLDNLPFYSGLLEHELRLPRCTRCSVWRYPIFPVCAECLCRDMAFVAVSGVGTIYMVILRERRTGYEGFPGCRAAEGENERVAIASIELAEQPGLRITSVAFSGSGRVPRMGEKVSLVWLDQGGAPFPAFTIEERA